MKLNVLVGGSAIFFFNLILTSNWTYFSSSHPSTMLLPDNYDSFFISRLPHPTVAGHQTQYNGFDKVCCLLSIHIIHIVIRTDNSVVGPLAGLAFIQLVQCLPVPLAAGSSTTRDSDDDLAADKIRPGVVEIDLWETVSLF